jgi:hypothetical protein
MEKIQGAVVPYVERYLKAAIAAGRGRVSGLFPMATREYLDWLFGTIAVEKFKYLGFRREETGRVSLGIVAAFVGSAMGLPLFSAQGKKWWNGAWDKFRGSLVDREMTPVESALSTCWLAYWRTLIQINPAVKSRLERIRPIYRGRGPMGVEISIGGGDRIYDRPVFTSSTVKGIANFDGSEDGAVSPYLDSTLFEPGRTDHHLLLIYSTHLMDDDEKELAQEIIPVLYEPRCATAGQHLAGWLDAETSDHLRRSFQEHLREDRDHLFDSEAKPEAGKKINRKKDKRSEEEKKEEEKQQTATEYLARIGRALGTFRGDNDLKSVITAEKGQSALQAICTAMVCRFPLVSLVAWNEISFNKGKKPEVVLGEKGEALIGEFKEKAMKGFGQGEVHVLDRNRIGLKFVPPGDTAFIFFLETAFQRHLGIGDQDQGEDEDTDGPDYNFTRWLIMRIGQLCSAAATKSGKFVNLEESPNLDSVLLRVIDFLREQGRNHREIGEFLGRSQPAVSRLLLRLDEARQKDSDDGGEAIHAASVVRGLSIAKSPSGKAK